MPAKKPTPQHTATLRDLARAERAVRILLPCICGALHPPGFVCDVAAQKAPGNGQWIVECCGRFIMQPNPRNEYITDDRRTAWGWPTIAAADKHALRWPGAESHLR